MSTTSSAPGKVILLGEHAAVYCNPVLVATIDLRTYVTVKKRNDEKFLLNNEAVGIKKFQFYYSQIPKLKKVVKYAIPVDTIEKLNEKFNFGLKEKEGLEIDIKSEIPVSSGLGSSASLASALVLAISEEFGKKLKKKEVANLSWEIENIIHKKSSGVDPFAVTFGGILRYQRGNFEKMKVKSYPKITIGNTGIISDTGEVVSDVMNLKEKYPNFFDFYLRAMVEIVDYGQKFLEKGNFKSFGEMMNINHGLLSAIGVSSPELEELVWAARKKSLGAKLCGAGRGGIMIALGNVSEEIKNAGGKVIKTKISKEGVRIEK